MSSWKRIDKEAIIVLGIIILSGLLMFGIFVCNDAKSQDYSGMIPSEYNQVIFKEKFDYIWNYIKGVPASYGGLAGFSGSQNYDTVYMDMKFDTVFAVTVSKAKALVNDIAVTKVISDSSFQIWRDSTAATDSIWWIAVGRLKRN